MDIIIALFAIALVGLLTLVVLKTHALGNGGETFITRWFPEERDKKIETRFKKSVRRLWHRTKVVCTALAHLLLEAVVHLLSRLLELLKTKTERMRNTVRGKGVLKKNGSASFFLKDIVEHKRNHTKKGGRIDD